MIKHFYSFIIETEALRLELDELNLLPEQKEHLLRVVDSSLHHAIVDLVLSELPEEDKTTFLRHLHTRQHEKLWKLLNHKVENIEEKIRSTAKELEREFIKDIKEVKGKG